MFDQILVDIRNGDIQGSENLARWVVIAIKEKKEELDKTCEFKKTYVQCLENSKNLILDVVYFDPAVINVLNYVLPGSLFKLDFLSLKKEFGKKIDSMEKHLEMAYANIARIGSRKIKRKSTILTHGYSSTVRQIVEDARNKEINLNIVVGGPKETGKLMAEELQKYCNVNLYPDACMLQAVRESDVILLGCEASINKGFYATIGSEALVVIAKKENKRVYICTDTLKNTDEFVIPKFQEFEKFWKNAPKNVNLICKNYEKISEDFVDGVICELGILKPKEFFKQKV